MRESTRRVSSEGESGRGAVTFVVIALLLLTACGNDAGHTASRCLPGKAACREASAEGGPAGSGGSSGSGGSGGSAPVDAAAESAAHPDATPPDAERDGCSGGACADHCAVGETLCSGVCVDLQTSSAHCGSCANDCGAGACNGGVCSSCEPVQTITELPARVSGSLASAADHVTLPCGTSPAPELVYSFTASETATYVFGTPGAQAAVSVLDGCGGVTLACEPDASRYSTTAYVGAGKTVTVVVEGAASVSFELRIRKAAADPCCEEHDTPGCGDTSIETCVCAVASGCCTDHWSATCDGLVNSLGCGLCQIDRPQVCGATECDRLDPTATFLGVGSCCTSSGECGAFYAGKCVVRDQHGTRDPACTTETVAGVRAQGCCRTDGRCGVDLSAVAMGCVAREDAPGVSLSPAACGTANPLPDFRNFESDQVRPLALSPDGTHLFAVNTPDDRLEIFTVDAGGLTHQGSVPVGLEPVAVAARTNGEVWVVNEVSDSVSLVDVGAVPPRVIRTLWVGDEPRDIVFGGPGGTRAFITTAHRGQNHPMDPQLSTPGVGRADVWVFDTAALGTAPGGTPSTIVNLFGDTPRALAVTPDGLTVYAAVYHSGNRTTSINEAAIAPDTLPPPTATVDGVAQPAVSLIVKFDGSNWVDETGHAWNSRVHFSLPDYDVFAIDAGASPPVEKARFSGVGTTLFNLAVNPKTGSVYVSNTDAHNETRFEPDVRARATETRITVLSGSSVVPRDLNPHIDLGVPSGSSAERSLSLGLPAGIAASADGAALYVAAVGSSKVAIIDTASLENGTFTPQASDQVRVQGGGPTGLVEDTAHGRLYVLTRFDNGISVIDVSSRTEAAHLALPNPEPSAVTAGRRFLYDTEDSSAHGDQSCASCHAFGDTDHLAWDLGNPSGQQVNGFHPMKGPMATQSLRGMAGHGPLHWRGDRSGALVPGGTFTDTDAAFHQFNPAFVSLLGRGAQLTDQDMQRFTDFALTITYPPNPIRALDDSLTADQKAALDIYRNRSVDIISTCNGCHTLSVTEGFFGTDGKSQFDAEPQTFKVPHLRNAYQKVGMFGTSGGLGIPSSGFMGDQIRGFGYLHDGSVDTLQSFLHASIFSLSDTERRQLSELLLAFDSNLAPIVGQQLTVDPSTAAGSSVRQRLGLLVQQGQVGSPRRTCDLVAQGMVAGEMRGYLMGADGTFVTDRAAESSLTATDMLALAGDPQSLLTFTCAPPGSGVRVALDRDRDGKRNRDELDQGTDPADPAQ